MFICSAITATRSAIIATRLDPIPVPDRPTRMPRTRPDTDCTHAPAPVLTMTRDEAVGVAEVFKVLGDESRVLILCTLIDAGELCVRHLAEAVDMTPSAVSHNLRILRTAGLVARRREGREVYYRPDDHHVSSLIALCADHTGHQAASRPRDGATAAHVTRETATDG